MAHDSKKQQVALGDWMKAQEGDQTFIVRVIALNERVVGVRATGAYVDLVGMGRVKKFIFDPANATLVLKSDGTAVKDL